MLLDYDMATNIVRWMKTKINGYRPFAVMSNELGDNRLSDRELLLKSSTFGSEENFLSNLSLPRKAPSACLYRRAHSPDEADCRSSSVTKDEQKSKGKRHLNFEELECDVSVEGCTLDQGGGLRQEFSFTLYDLDGHGKITKDDIAGLVKTIYETLGQSVRVPHYGSKTIKVKLTVSPEKKVCKSNDETTSPTVTKTHDLTGATPNDNKRSSDFHSTKTREQRKYRQEQKFCRRRHSISSSGLSEDREADVSEDDDEAPLNNKINNPALRNIGASTAFSKLKRRSSSLQRQELFQIIQANMEKNNLCFQASRKPTSNNAVCSSHHRNRTKSGQPLSRKSVNTWESSAQPEKCDAGKMFLNSFSMKSNNDDVSSRPAHQRSHSYDLPNRSYAENEEMTTKKKQPTSHQLKHRFRAFDQARAKEQVVRWLEQEFSSSPTYFNNHKKNNNLNNSKTTSKEEVKSKSRSRSNEKHEHHHIHEHVHHHYHHYHESPIVI